LHSTAAETVRYLRAHGGFISGQEIADRLGVTRAAVWKHITVLRENGFDISSSTKKGYKLDSVPDIPSEEVLSSLLNTISFGKTIEYHQVIESTNTRAMSLGHQGASEGTVVTADSQTAGKSKGGGSWVSPSGKNLYMSVLLKPEVSADRLFEVERMALDSLARAVSACCPELPLELLETGLFTGERKIGGVLCEACGEIGRIHHAVAGIGLNVTHRSESPYTGSILELTGRTLSRAELTASVLEYFEAAYRKWLRHEQR